MKPWITSYVLKLIHHRDRLFHKKKDNPSNYDIKQAYTLFRNRTTRELKKAKKAYYNKYFENNIKNMKNTWTGIKDLINLRNNNQTSINQLRYRGKHISSDLDMSNAFNNFFTNIGPQLDAKIPHHQRPNKELHFLSDRIPHTFLISSTNNKEIIEIIDSLDSSKSTGPCKIPINLLKIAKNEIAPPLSDICNSSFVEGTFPQKNKIAKVIPVHKNGSTEDVNNYRPISLLPTLSKIMEKLVASRLTTYLELHSILYPKQFGFRSGFSTTHSLTSITEAIKNSLDKKKYGCGVSTPSIMKYY